MEAERWEAILARFGACQPFQCSQVVRTLNSTFCTSLAGHYGQRPDPAAPARNPREQMLTAPFTANGAESAPAPCPGMFLNKPHLVLIAIQQISGPGCKKRGGSVFMPAARCPGPA